MDPQALRPSRYVLRASVLLALFVLAACGARTNVSATSNVTALYSHVWITVQEVDFNTSATAAPSDKSWLTFPLSTPQTFDLATVTNGGLAIFGSSLNIPQGTYAQMRLLLTDSSATLATSAQTAGLLYNDQVQYLDSSGAAVAAPLVLVHPEQGIGLSVSLTIPNNTKAFIEEFTAATDSTANTTTGTTTGTTLGTTTPTTTLGTTGTTGTTTCDTTTTSTTTTTPVTTTSDDCSAATTTPFAVAIAIDTERDLVPFTYSGQPGFYLNPHLVAYDLTTAGTIQGTVDVSGLTAATTTSTTGTVTSATASGNPQIEVTAETLSTDTTRHVVVASAPVLSDGSFVLYPLTTNATTAGGTTTTTYDLVIHGPQINTMIIKAVPVSVAAPAAATQLALTTVALTSVADFTVNVATTPAFTTAGALVQFYQTVPVSGEVPYVVAQQPIDPINHDFAGDFALSAGQIMVATYSGGVTSTPVADTPTEGLGTYQVSAIAPGFTDGPFGKKVTATNPITTTAITFTLTPLAVASGAAAKTITATTAVTSPGKYNQGVLIASNDGAIVALTPLSSILGTGAGSVTITAVPAGSSSQTLSSGVYDITAWVWNSTNPSGTLSRQSSATSVDLSAGNSASVSVTID